MRDLAFYNTGCDRGTGFGRLLVLARRLLRRVQRPFFRRQEQLLNELHDRIDSAAASAERSRTTADARLSAHEDQSQAIGDELAEVAAAVPALVTFGWDCHAAAGRIAALEEQVRHLSELIRGRPLAAGPVTSVPYNRPLPPARDARSFGGHRRMRVLVALSSRNQLYSGLGRVLFNLAPRLAGRVSFEFVIDDTETENLNRLLAFADRNHFPVHVGRGRPDPRCMDVSNDLLPSLLRGGGWDVVECLSWANTGTNAAVLDHIRDDAALAFTGYHEPTWTLPGVTAGQAAFIDYTYRRVVARSNVVFCASPWERRFLQSWNPLRGQCLYLPAGCDFGSFAPGPDRRRPQLLFVGDFAEPRKRFDRTLAIFERLHRRRPDLRLKAIGNRSAEYRDQLPPALRDAVELSGYVSDADLRAAYRESLGTFMLSDYEAFGMPSIESIASGTPVFLHHQEAVWSIFRDVPGAYFTDANDADATADEIERVIGHLADTSTLIAEDRPRLAARFGWDALAERKWQALVSACLRVKGRLPATFGLAPC